MTRAESRNDEQIQQNDHEWLTMGEQQQEMVEKYREYRGDKKYSYFAKVFLHHSRRISKPTCRLGTIIFVYNISGKRWQIEANCDTFELAGT